MDYGSRRNSWRWNCYRRSIINSDIRRLNDFMKLNSLALLSSLLVIISISLITYNQSSNPNIYIIIVLSVVLGIISIYLLANVLKSNSKKGN